MTSILSVAVFLVQVRRISDPLLFPQALEWDDVTLSVANSIEHSSSSDANRQIFKNFDAIYEHETRFPCP